MTEFKSGATYYKDELTEAERQEMKDYIQETLTTHLLPDYYTVDDEAELSKHYSPEVVEKLVTGDYEFTGNVDHLVNYVYQRITETGSYGWGTKQATGDESDFDESVFNLGLDYFSSCGFSTNLDSEWHE